MVLSLCNHHASPSRFPVISMGYDGFQMSNCLGTSAMCKESRQNWLPAPLDLQGSGRAHIKKTPDYAGALFVKTCLLYQNCPKHEPGTVNAVPVVGAQALQPVRQPPVHYSRTGHQHALYGQHCDDSLLARSPSRGGTADRSARRRLIGERGTQAHPRQQCDGGAMNRSAVLKGPLRKESRRRDGRGACGASVEMKVATPTFPPLR